ncbi:protein LphB [Fluoribacter dumoffii]|uniref:protein LphB n=1 Tax=Fluoribacter dumoffii TaxID=463 RepID=UPI0022443615|nr:protein LphB [Fluoribacter dumoffii]MCW8384976.1 protein LphB [Fluoribacter dumoffii]MCW8496625.1 protein LphB [Fluoribacter dumoffii]
MKFGFRWYDSFLILLLFYLFVLQIQAIWPFTIDDMFISLRYAKHWAAGKGILWNLQAPPVEGYSNFSFVVLGALTLLLNGNPVVFLKMAGIAGLFFTCRFIYLISRFWFTPRESLLPCVGLLLYKGQIIWAASGLETTVYEALLCGAVYYCLRGMGYGLFPASRGTSITRYFIFSGIFLAFAGLTRPEAPAFMILFLILIYWDRSKENLRHYRNSVLLFCFMLLLFYGPYFLWRLYYFGFLFPNSVYCKGVAKTFTFTLDLAYLKMIWPLAFLALPACLQSEDKKPYFLWLPSVLYLILLVNSDPVVAFENRLFLPAFALLLPLAVQGIRLFLYGVWPRKNLHFSLFFYLSSLLVLLLIIPKMSLADYRYFSQNPVRGELLRNKVVAWLNRNTSPDDWVVLADSGLIPYSSNLNFIDSYCLNNLAMAHYSTKDMYAEFCEAIWQKKPAVIILTSLIKQGKIIYTPSDACLKEKLHQYNYQLRATYVSNNPDSIYRYEIYEDPIILPAKKREF